MPSITRSGSSPGLSVFQSPSIILSSDDSDIVTIKKVSSSIKANIGKRNLFRNIPTDGPRLRKSAILKCFGTLVSSTPIIESKPDECFISPITPDESIKPVSKRKSKASVRNAVKSFNAKIKQENKLRSSRKNASVQANEEINESKIQEILQVDACTTEQLQTSLFKKPTVTTISKFKSRQTQTSDSLNASHRNDLTNEVELLPPLTSAVENCVNVLVNSLDQPKEDFVCNSIISISDLSVLEENNLDGQEINEQVEDPANNSMIFSELPAEEGKTEDSTVNQIVTEPVASNVEELLVLSHLNLETELKQIETVEQKVKEEVTKTGRIAMQFTPLRLRLRSRNVNGNRPNRTPIQPRLKSKKRKCIEVDDNKAKKQSLEIPPLSFRTDPEEPVLEQKEITKSQEEFPVQKKGNGKKKNNKKARVTKTTLKKSENSVAGALPNKESSQDLRRPTMLQLQLSQLQKFSPCVVLEKMQIHPSDCVRTRSQIKRQNNLPPESSVDVTSESRLPESTMDIPDGRDTKTVTVDLYQYVVHRKSGFYQLPDEPITAARAEGRPQRTRRPPKQFIQAAFVPQLPALRRTTKFKPEKIAVQDEVRKGAKKARTHVPLRYNLRSSRSSNTSLFLPSICTTEGKQSKKESNKKVSSRARKRLQDVTENAIMANSCVEEVGGTVKKVTAKKKVVKKLDYENVLQSEESVCNGNFMFDQTQICISDNTITGVRRIGQNENTQEEIAEENCNFQCLINDEPVDVKCYSKIPTFESNGKHPIIGIPVMVNKSQNSEVTVGYIKILPNKKLFVEVTKTFFTLYTVMKGSGVAKIANQHFVLDEGSIIFLPLGFSYFIHNNSSSPLILQYTINSKIS